MGKCVEKLPHSCGSRDALQVFEETDGSYHGYCFACATYIHNPYNDKPAGYKPAVIKKTEEEIQAELKEIQGYQVLDLPARGLRAESLAYYNIKVAVSEQDGTTPVAVYFPYEKKGVLSAYKVRLLEQKRMWSIGQFKGADLFGWQQALSTGAKRL